MKAFHELRALLEAEFSCLMLVIPSELTEELAKLQLALDEADFTDKGLEEDLHITILYGIHTKDAQEVWKVVDDFGPIGFELHEVSIFENEKFDVVKISIVSDDLHKLHEKLKDKLPVTETHAYDPHLTLAYVKKGLGAKYVDKLKDMLLADQQIYSSNDVDFSTPDEDHEYHSL